MAESYIDYKKFDIKNAVSVGGETGRKKVKREDGVTYQLKNSVKGSGLFRYIKEGGTDQANFGELIAANISRSVIESDQDSQAKVELIPEVSLVYDEDNKKVLVSSKYL